MAQYAQPVRDGLYLDRTCKNTEASASIAVGTAVKIDTGTYAVTTAADPMPVVAFDDSDSTDLFYGIAQETIAAGAYGKICVWGSAIGIAGTSGVTANGMLVADAAVSHGGRLTTLPDAVTHVGRFVGIAEHTAADGEYVKVWITRGATTKA